VAPLLKSEVDARSGDRSLTEAVLNENLPSIATIRGYLADIDYEKYGFAFLESEQQAMDFMKMLCDMGCAKYHTAQSYFDHFVRPGGLLDVLEGRVTKKDMAVKALSIARRTHCRCHEVGSFKLKTRTL
jgi:hypothetical protein